MNLLTKKSQWDRPAAPAETASVHDEPGGPPPTYSYDQSGNTQDPEKRTKSATTKQEEEENDARYAAQLQAEEDARANRSGMMPDANYATKPIPIVDNYQSERSTGKKGGFLGKLLGKYIHQPSAGRQQQYYPPQGYGPARYESGYPQTSHSYPPHQGFHGSSGTMGMPPRRGHGFPGGAMGGAALGVGGGLLGGALLADAIGDHNRHDGGSGSSSGHGGSDAGGYDGGDGGYDGGDGGGGGDGGF